MTLKRPRLPQSLRNLVRQRAKQQCEYCHTPEWLTGLEAEIDHIQPVADGGETQRENLCLACATCNGYKHAQTQAQDPLTGETVDLFHPRQQVWAEHFAWDAVGTQLIGLTACGRATVQALQFNRALALSARTIWMRAGFYPPHN